jgi:RHS repeat-associated protein
MITAANDYYPFGLHMEGVVNNTPVTNAPNQYAYNGGSRWSNELNNMANYLTTPFREYDPVLGRFNGVDIMATKYANLSPYNYGFNNPVYWNDPTGADVEPPTWQQLMAAINALLEDGGGTWSRTAWDEGATGSGRGGGSCRGCTFFSALADGGSYTYHSNGNGTGTLYVWTSTSTYSQARDEYQGQADLSIIDVNMNTKTASFTGFGWGDGVIDGNSLFSKFKNGFLNGPRSNEISPSNLTGGLGLMTSYVNTAVRNDANYARSFTDLRKVATASKYVNNAGKAIGGVAIVMTGIEALSDRNITVGDGFKMLIAGASLAFPVFGVLYAVADMTVMFTTGTGLTDRIANGIDSSTGGLGLKY